MDITRFFKLLKRYFWLLIIIPVITGAITYYFSKNLTKEYKSEVQISTGLVDQSKQLTSQSQNDYFKTSQQFANIFEKIKMRKMMSILSYNLIIHDLENSKTSFRKYSPKVDSLSAAQKLDVVNEYKQRLLSKTPITTFDNNGKYKLFDILESMGYDDYTINKKLSISRSENSDFVNIEFISENPFLSAYLVNTLATEFIRNFTLDTYTNQNNSIAMLDSLLKKKELDMNSKNSALKEFKMKSGILNLDGQAAGVYAQISQYEERKAAAIRDIQANQGALAEIDSKLKGAGGNNTANLNAIAVQDNRILLNIKNQLKVANDKYIDGNFKPADKRKIDSLQTLLNAQSGKSYEVSTENPQTVRQALMQQRDAIEISSAQIKNTISSIDKQLSTLRAQYSTMVPYDANITNYTRDADIATKDYMAALDRTNQGKTEQTNGVKLGIAQVGLPGTAQPSKTIIFVAVAAIASFMVCFVSLVMSFLLDTAIYSPMQLAKETGSPVVGSLNHIKAENKEPKDIWNDDHLNPEYTIFKDLVRSLRFELDRELTNTNSQILGITSLGNKAGKSFIASTLIYSFAMTGKKVLLISGEQEETERPVSQKLIPSEFFETFLVKKEIQTEDLITVFNNKAHNSSLLETQSAHNLKIGFDVLRKEFDLIVIDINSLVEINKAKEWLSFTDRSIAIFEYGDVIKEEHKSSIKYIKDHPGFMGWVLNKVREKAIS